MPAVNPAYDPQTKTWFLEDPEAEAPTLKELLAKLRKIPDSHERKRQEWRIENYYPLGVEVRMGADSVTLEKCVEQKTIAMLGQKSAHRSIQWRTTSALQKPEPAPIQPAPNESGPPCVRGPIVRKWQTRHKFQKWDPVVYEQVLDMWAQGIKGNVIAEKLGLTVVQVSAHMVPHARAHGDPRAVSRMPHCGIKRRGRESPKSAVDRAPADSKADISQSSS